MRLIPYRLADKPPRSSAFENQTAEKKTHTQILRAFWDKRAHFSLPSKRKTWNQKKKHVENENDHRRRWFYREDRCWLEVNRVIPKAKG